MLYALWAVHPCKVDAAHRAVQFVLRAACAEVAGGLPARTLLEAMAAYPEAAVHDADMLWAWLVCPCPLPPGLTVTAIPPFCLFGSYPRPPQLHLSILQGLDSTETPTPSTSASAQQLAA